MHTYRPLGNCTYFSFSCHHQMLFGGGPQMNKFEQLSSDHHQITIKPTTICFYEESRVRYKWQMSCLYSGRSIIIRLNCAQLRVTVCAQLCQDVTNRRQVPRSDEE